MTHSRPQVIGHRGAPGHRPEHTLASYRLAIALGADAVEPDLVMTADGVAVIRHETEIGGTTDVARHPELAARRRWGQVEGRKVRGWFCEDFTLAELKTLRAIERMPGRRPLNTAWDGLFEVATLDELLLVLAEESRLRGRRIGLHAELKAASYLTSIGLPLEDTVLGSLRDHGLEEPGSGVVLQSFETACLHRLAARTTLPLVQLVDDPRSAMLSPSGLTALATYVATIGLAVPILLERPGLVGPAHRAGLEVLAYTIRHDDPGGPGAAAARVEALVAAGVDGLFSDQPDQTLAVCGAAARSMSATTSPTRSTSTSFGTITQATR